jgi:hypothetical protein
MGRRGRPPTLKDRKTTSVSLESWQAEFLIEKGIDLSKFVRDNIDALMQSDESPIEQLTREIEQLDVEIQEMETIKRQKEAKRKELEDRVEAKNKESMVINEFETKRRGYIIDYIENVHNKTTCNRLWLEHLRDDWKLHSFDEAKEYVMGVWLEEGVPEERIKTYLKMN